MKTEPSLDRGKTGAAFRRDQSKQDYETPTEFIAAESEPHDEVDAVASALERRAGRVVVEVRVRPAVGERTCSLKAAK